MSLWIRADSFPRPLLKGTANTLAKAISALLLALASNLGPAQAQSEGTRSYSIAALYDSWEGNGGSCTHPETLKLSNGGTFGLIQGD